MTNYTTAEVSFAFHYDGTTDLISIDVTQGPLFYQGSGSLHPLFAATPKGVTNISIVSQTGNLSNTKQVSATGVISGTWLEVTIPAGLSAGSFIVFATLKY